MTWMIAAVAAAFVVVIIRRALSVADWQRARLNHRYWGRSRGIMLLEFALVLPVLLLVVLGGLDLSRMAGARNDLNYTAENVAACLSHTPANCKDAQAYAQQVASGVGLTGPLTATVTAGSVTIGYLWAPVSPFFHAVTMTARATAP